MTERETFMQRLSAALDEGLSDMKFFFMSDRAMQPEEVFAAANAADDAIKNGRRHETWNGNDAA